MALIAALGFSFKQVQAKAGFFISTAFNGPDTARLSNNLTALGHCGVIRALHRITYYGSVRSAQIIGVQEEQSTRFRFRRRYGSLGSKDTCGTKRIALHVTVTMADPEH